MNDVMTSAVDYNTRARAKTHHNTALEQQKEFKAIVNKVASLFSIDVTQETFEQWKRRKGF